MKMTEARVDMNSRAAEALKSVLSEVSTLKLKEIRRASAFSSRQPDSWPALTSSAAPTHWPAQSRPMRTPAIFSRRSGNYTKAPLVLPATRRRFS